MAATRVGDINLLSSCPPPHALAANQFTVRVLSINIIGLEAPRVTSRGVKDVIAAVFGRSRPPINYGIHPIKPSSKLDKQKRERRPTDSLNGASCTTFSSLLSGRRLPNLWSSDQTFVIWPRGGREGEEGEEEERGGMRREIL